MEPISIEPWYDNSLVSGVIGVSLGVFLAYVIEWVRSQNRRKVLWSALATEVHLCKKTAEQYCPDDAKAAPLYRMPLIAFKNGFGELVSSGAMDRHEFRDLSQFYSWVEDINRGLDLATQARYQGGQSGKLLLEEHSRLKAKTRSLIDDYFPAADAVVQRHCKAIPVTS